MDAELIDGTNLDGKMYTALMPVKIISVKLKWNFEKTGMCSAIPYRKKWKSWIKELSWVKRVETGNHFLKKSSELVCFGLKCLHSKHPRGPNVQVTRSCAALMFLYPSLPCSGYSGHTGLFLSLEHLEVPLILEHSQTLFFLPGTALFSSWPLPCLLMADTKKPPP